MEPPKATTAPKPPAYFKIYFAAMSYCIFIPGFWNQERPWGPDGQPHSHPEDFHRGQSESPEYLGRTDFPTLSVLSLLAGSELY